MQAFEFHFNPKIKEDLVFDSFCFEPENIYEKRMGSLYMTGFLKNTLPQNIHFLDKLAKVIKERFYRSATLTPEKSLKESLKESNEFLESITKKGDVSWLGNLSFAAVSLKNFEFNFTKIGNVKVFLLRGGQIIDIDSKLQNQEIEPYPLKVFGNIVSGKLAEDDVILILTKDVADLFKNHGLLRKIADLEPFGEKELKEILKNKKDELQKIFGVCLILFLTNKSFDAKKENLFPNIGLKDFSIKGAFSPSFRSLMNLTQKIKTIQIFQMPKMPKPKIGPSKKTKDIKLSLKPKLKIPKINFSPSNSFKNFGLKEKLTKKLIPIFVLLFFLVAGSFIFERQNEKQIVIYREKLNQIQIKLDRAESLLVLSETNPQALQDANLLLDQCWNEISLIIKEIPNPPEDLNRQIASLKNNIYKDLSQTNKLTVIENPELVFEFSVEEFIPQKIITANNKIYLFSPYSSKLIEANPSNNEKRGYDFSSKGFDEAVIFKDSILFFSKPDKLIKFKDGNFDNAETLILPSTDSNLGELSSFNSNLYFLDEGSDKIVKYIFQNGWKQPQFWLVSPKTINANSFVVDGNAWVLNKDNSISRYYSGTIQDTIKVNLFPSPKLFSKIFTPYPLYPLYLSEPIQSRIIVLDKNGKIVRQIQSEKFDNILDFTVSEDGKIIYILNGLKIFKVNI